MAGEVPNNPSLPEQATAAELQQFMELANTPANLGSNWFNQFNLRFSGLETDQQYVYANMVTQEGFLGYKYRQIYQTEDSRTLWTLGATDIRAMQAMKEYGWYEKYSAEDSRLKEDFQALIFGAGPEKYSSFPRNDLIDKNPIVNKRVTEGMPRVLQLVMAAKALTGLSNRSDWRETSGEMMANLPGVFGLSDAELHAVTKVASAARKNAGLISIAAQRPEIMERYTMDAEGQIDFDTFGGLEAIRGTARRAFNEFIDANGRGINAAEWLDLEFAVGPQLADVLELEERKALASESILKKPFVLNAALKLYLDSEEVARLARRHIEDTLSQEDADDVRGIIRSARQLDAPESLIKAAIYERFRVVFEVVETERGETDTELELFVQPYKLAAEEMAELDAVNKLKEYHNAATNSDLRWPVEGWTGAPEEDEVVEILAHRQDVARSRLRAAEKDIQATIAQLLA